MDNVEKGAKLLLIVEKFMKENEITCDETIHQCDWVIENAYSFIEELCEVVGYPEENDDD